MSPEETARRCTETAIKVVRADDTWINLSWGDDPLDFILQTDAQIDDLITRLQAVRGR